MSLRLGATAGPALLVFLLGSLAASPAAAAAVIGAKNSKVYHTHADECPAAKRISLDNIVRFASVDEAEKSGRRLCKTCAKIEDGAQRSNDRDAAAKGKSGGGSGDSPKKKGTERGGGAGDDPPGGPPSETESLPEFVRLTDVLPGGTMELDNGEKAAFLGVICPQEGQAHADDAARFIKEQTQGRRVKLSRDAQAGSAGFHDSLGRLLGYVMPEPDGRDLGAELLFQGYAWIDREARFERRSEYLRREEEAWHAERGIWKPLEGEAGKTQVVTGRHAQYYHAPDCPHSAHLTGRITLTINEAKARRLPPCSLYDVKAHKDKKMEKKKPSG
jgi:endonuclease YncB( thermonuclease family)